MNFVLNIQQMMYLCVVTSKTYTDGSDIGQHTTVRYEVVVVGICAEEGSDVRCGRCNKNYNRFLSSEVIGYCGTSASKFVHLADVEHSSYVHLNELFTGRVGDICPRLHQDNNSNNFSSVFVNNDMLFDPNNIPHVDALQADIVQRFGFNPHSLQRLVLSSYDDEVNEHVHMYLVLPPLNASPIHYICQVLLRSEMFDHYTPIRRRITALIGPPGTGKTQTIMSLIAVTYGMLDDRGVTAIRFANLRRQWRRYIAKTRGQRVEHYHVTNAVRKVQMPKILLVAPTNKAVDVLEDRLQKGVPVYNESSNRWVMVSLI